MFSRVSSRIVANLSATHTSGIHPIVLPLGFMRSQTICSAFTRGFSAYARKSKYGAIPKPKTSTVLPTSISVGESLVGGSAILGVGALCYYGAGLGSQAGAIDTAQFWPAFARERVSSTFTAFGAGIAMTAAQAYAIYQSGFAARMMRMSPWVVLGGTLVACIGSQVLVHSVSYENKFLKFCAYSLFTGCTAAMISPIVGLGGAIVYKAAAYTSVVVGSMCAVAACAPSDKFLYMGGPLACGLGIVVCASFGGMFFPANAMLHSISMYGGLVLFSGFVLYDVQKFVHKAQIRQYYYDPVNECIGIYLDTVNIFIRIASILGNQKNK